MTYLDHAASTQVRPEVVDLVAREAREGDVILVMSNGGFGGIHQKLLQALGR